MNYYNNKTDEDDDVNKTLFEPKREACLKILGKIPRDGLRDVWNKLIARFCLRRFTIFIIRRERDEHLYYDNEMINFNLFDLSI